MKKILLILLFACLPAEVRPAEEIRNFASGIEVQADSSMVVTETIRVCAEGDQIKRGIYRDFPTLYSGPAGLRITVPFEVLEILRDGKPEPWHSERHANGIRIYLGSGDVFLPHAETTYTIKYRTGGQIGFFKEFDELYYVRYLAGWVFGVWSLAQALSLWVCAIFLAGIALCAVFQHLLKRPTPEGQEIRDRIRGFKQYLSVAESERLGLENPPERTPELFEKFLPFALALGVEQAWSEKFSDVLASASIAQDSGVISPSFPLATATAFAGALSGAISSASTAPGSSSGSGGGGSSGGGGGGGGGGGW